MTRQSLTYLIVCTLLLLTACSEATDILPEKEQTPAEAVAFSAYLNRAAATSRAGMTGAIGNESLKGSAEGFGVYAFHGNDDVLYASGSLQPEFMYNQQVVWSAALPQSWQYSPLKYWPNESGPDAISAATDRLSFFAYAPYVAATPETGQLTSAYSGDALTTGITALSSHHHRGDPWVQYGVSFDAGHQVDLCWADAAAGTTIDLTKQTVGEHVDLNFCHALAALNIQIDAVMDAITVSGSSSVDANTRIYMRSVSFEGFTTSGALNLHNRVAATPRWLGNYGEGLPSTAGVTIHDGRRDRHEGSGANGNEWPTGLNSAVVQSGVYTVDGSTITHTETDGVTATAVNLFTPPAAGTAEQQLAAPVYVIPNGQPLRVTVAYDVETYDPNLKYQYLSDDVTYGSSIPNVISSLVRQGGDGLVLQAGKQYTVRLHLGMTSVKVDVLEVKPWQDGVEVPVLVE